MSDDELDVDALEALDESEEEPGSETESESSESDSDEENSEDDDFDEPIIENFSKTSVVTIISTPEKRMTSSQVSKLELVRIKCIRVQQINTGDVIYVDPKGMTDSEDIAQEEIRQGKCPLSILRKYGPITEQWSVNELTGWELHEPTLSKK